MTKRRETVEALGWYGAGAILLAYALVSFRLIAVHGLVYQLLNLTGALGIATISIRKKALQPAVLNVVWAVIAFSALIGLVVQ